MKVPYPIVEGLFLYLGVSIWLILHYPAKFLLHSLYSVKLFPNLSILNILSLLRQQSNFIHINRYPSVHLLYPSDHATLMIYLHSSFSNHISSNLKCRLRFCPLPVRWTIKCVWSDPIIRSLVDWMFWLTATQTELMRTRYIRSETLSTPLWLFGNVNFDLFAPKFSIYISSIISLISFIWCWDIGKRLSFSCWWLMTLKSPNLPCAPFQYSWDHPSFVSSFVDQHPRTPTSLGLGLVGFLIELHSLSC